MGRNKNKAKPLSSGSQPAQVQPSPLAPPSNPAQSATDQRQDRRIFWTQAGTVLAVVLNIILAYFAFSSARSANQSAKEAAEANRLTLAAQDRATGKVQARFEFVDDGKNEQERMKPYMRKQEGFDNQVFRIESVDEMLRWGPNVRIKNTGTEPIDAIRIGVTYDIGVPYGKGVTQIYPVPIIYTEEVGYEFANFGKLTSGRTARLYFHPLLLHQISRLRWPEYADKDQNGIFTVRVHCRLAGSPSYDQTENNARSIFDFHWRPAGFKSDAKGVKEVVEMKPWIRLE